MKTLLAFLATGASVAAAVVISYSLSLSQGFNMRGGNQLPVGYVTSLSIAGSALLPDLQVTDPTTGAKITAVGVMGSYSWGGGVTDPMNFGFNISAGNRARLAALMQGNITTAPVLVNYEVFSFTSATGFFLGMKPTNSLQALLNLNGLNLGAAPDPSVPTPINYAVRLGISPAAISQTINYQALPGQRVVKQWGITTF
ncbi:MAG: hypothetical protein ACXWR4_06920 [Bdellovibrionota bacterium]